MDYIISSFRTKSGLSDNPPSHGGFSAVHKNGSYPARQVIIAGSRDFTDSSQLCSFADEALADREILHMTVL